MSAEKLSAYLGERGQLTDWQGNVIGTYRILSTWRTPRSFVSSTMSSVEATLQDGSVYTGRSAGKGMLFNGKLSKRRMKNPRPRLGTKKPLRASSATGKRPSKRLVARRKDNTKKGYFPNPRQVAAAHRKKKNYAVQVKKHGKWITAFEYDNESAAVDQARIMGKIFPTYTIRAVKK